MRLSVCAALLCLAVVGLSFGADADAAIRKTIDIPAQGLGPALNTLAKERNLQVVYRSEIVGSLRTRGVSGALTVDEALQALLSGTGLTYRYLDDRTVTIMPAATDKVTSGNDGRGPLPQSAGEDARAPLRLAQSEPDKKLQNTDTKNSDADSVQNVPGKSSDSKDAGNTGLDEIVVTGTHIRGAPLSAPIIEITQADIERSGYTNVGDVIRSLPQNFSGGNNPQNIGSTPLFSDGSDNGGTSPNLRGLGSGSTLTLVNGHRLADDTTDSGVDVSFIPMAAIERIDVVTDGASAVYGADAVGGVVNFVLKKDYDGAQTSALVGNSTDGGAHETQFNQLIGKSWQSGGALLAFVYDKQAPVYASERDFAELAAQPLSLLPGTEQKSFFLSTHQEISSHASAFVDGLYGTRSNNSAATFPGPVNYVGYGNNSVKQYDVNVGITLKLPRDWQLTTVVSSAVNLAAGEFTGEPLLNEDGRTRSIEEDTGGSLFALPAGDVRLALGAGYRHEAFALSEPGYQAGGARSVKYAYGELAVPIISANQKSAAAPVGS